MIKELTEREATKIFNLFGASFADFEKQYPKIMEPLAKPSSLDFTAREFFYWCDKGVIDVPKLKDAQSPWTRLNLLDVIWIRIVKELRKFNFPFPSIVKIKDDLFQNIFLKMLDLNDDEISLILNEIEDDDVKKIFHQIIIQAKKNPELLKKQFGPLVSPIGALLAEILLLNRVINIHLCKIEEDFIIVFEGYSLQPTSQDTLDALKSSTHLSLCLNELIAEHLLDVKCEKINKDFGLISDQEIEILAAIRNKEITEITINKGHNEKLSFIVTKRSELKDDQVQTIKRLLRMNEFDDVRVVLRNDKHIYLENKTRKKI